MSATVRGIFGLKASVPSTTPQAVPANAALALIQRVDPDWPDYRAYLALADPGHRDLDVARALQPILGPADVTQRTDWLCAIAESGLFTGDRSRAKTAAEAVAARLLMLLRCLEWDKAFDPSPRLFAAIARLLGDADHWSRSNWVNRHAVEHWHKRLVAIAAAGHRPTAEDRRLLLVHRNKMALALAAGHGDRGSARSLAAMIAWVDEVCGTTPGQADRIAALTTASTTDGYFPAEPPDFRFWVELIVAAARHTATIAAELRAKTLPAWLSDPAEYSRRFPSVDDLSRPFGWWTDEEARAQFGDGPLRGYGWAAQQKQRPASPADIHACLDTPATLATLNVAWDIEAIPAADRLIDHADPGQAALLLLHLADAKPSPTPPAAWLKRARALAKADGTAMPRVAAWLEGWAAVAPSEATVTRYANYFEVVEAADWLRSVVPNLPGAPPEQVDHVARALAIRAGARYTDIGFLFARDGEMRSARNYSREHNGAPLRADHRKPSLVNEAVLRGACWLLGDAADPATVDLLERAALSAMAYSDGKGARSRPVANAAIASLARIGTAPALEALGRLRRSVRDKAIANTVARALAGVADTLGVAVPDLEEMSVPDYGFA